MTGKEMVNEARQDLLQEKQRQHIARIKNVLQEIASATQALAMSQKELSELENINITQ